MPNGLAVFSSRYSQTFVWLFIYIFLLKILLKQKKILFYYIIRRSSGDASSNVMVPGFVNKGWNLLQDVFAPGATPGGAGVGEDGSRKSRCVRNKTKIVNKIWQKTVPSILTFCCTVVCTIVTQLKLPCQLNIAKIPRWRYFDFWNHFNTCLQAIFFSLLYTTYYAEF